MNAGSNESPTRVSRQFLVLIGIFAFAAACTGSAIDEAATFEPGEARDAVVQAALSAPAGKTVQVTVSNGSSVALAEGAVMLVPQTVFDEVATKAFYQYVHGTWDVRTAARFAGLTVNVSVFVVPPLAAGASYTQLVKLPAGSQLFYASKVAGSTTDFVISENMMNVPSGASGTFQTGYRIDSSGTLIRGNVTTGAASNVAVIANDVTQNCSASGNMARQTSLISDNFATVPNTSDWPMNSGYDAEFNGDWFTDGITARVWNPTAGNPEAPRPMTTGFVKFWDVCPTAGSTISVTANVNADFKNLESSATLVLYYFDAKGALIRVDANHKLGAGNMRKTTLFESPVPLNARRIAIAPMAYLSADDTGNISFSQLDAVYEPSNTYKIAPVVSDSLAIATVSANHPSGWSEFGGDYFVMAKESWVTVWNPMWGGDKSKVLPVDTGLTKRFSLSGVQPGDLIDARVFAAATFTDPASFARIRLVFFNAKGAELGSVDSDRLSLRSYASLDVLKQPIPTGASQVEVILNASLGAKETSSFYAQSLNVNTRRLSLK